MTEDPAIVVPVNVRVVFFVKLSVFDVPESDEALKSGVDGTSTGSAYRRITTPDPPAAPLLNESGLTLDMPEPPPPPVFASPAIAATGFPFNLYPA